MMMKLKCKIMNSKIFKMIWKWKVVMFLIMKMMKMKMMKKKYNFKNISKTLFYLYKKSIL